MNRFDSAGSSRWAALRGMASAYTALAIWLVAALSATLGPAALAQQGQGTIIAGTIGCQNWDTLKALSQFKSDGDQVAFNKLAQPAFATGDCIDLNVGQVVFVLDVGVLTQSIQVRPQGSTRTYWTVFKAVKW
jgi:hypothetical protein